MLPCSTWEMAAYRACKLTARSGTSKGAVASVSKQLLVIAGQNDEPYNSQLLCWGGVWGLRMNLHLYLEVWRHLEEVSTDEVQFIGNSINSRIVLGQQQTGHADISHDSCLAFGSKLD